jgi:hypothetical protein
MRLELWDLGDRIRVLFDLSSMDSPRWDVVLRHTRVPAISPPEVVFRGTKVLEQVKLVRHHDRSLARKG